MPTGYRYVISKEGSCYRLKIFTHPLSYGRLDMTLVVRSGGSEERADFSVLVRKATTSATAGAGGTSGPTSPIPTMEMGTGTGGSFSPSQLTRSSPSPQVVTVTTVVEEPGGDLLLPLGGIAGVLTLLVVLMIKRRR